MLSFSHVSVRQITAQFLISSETLILSRRRSSLLSRERTLDRKREMESGPSRLSALALSLASTPARFPSLQSTLASLPFAPLFVPLCPATPVSGEVVKQASCVGRPVVGPVLTGQHRKARLAFATEHQNWQICHRRLVLFTDESRFYLSTCDRLDRLWRRYGECYTTCNIIQHDWFGGGSVMVWGGISLEGCTDLYRPDNGTLTAIRHRDEILGPVVRPYTGAVGPGFLLVHINARPHVV
ncbi:hypothetical protein NFI96_002688 [Prochilodus magdalenae]|nr:hypothetical protein NFI96_002688 [Prochilodus magdalenae]